MIELNIESHSSVPKYRQIVNAVINGIEIGTLKRDQQLPSINELSEEYYLARDTVEKAYNVLKKEGIIQAVQGKGFFIRRDGPGQLRVLLIMNKLSAYKKMIYYAMLNKLGSDAVVDLRIHHHSAQRFKKLLEENLGQYHFYVVMPHFYEETEQVNIVKLLEQIPRQELIILDRDLSDLNGSYSAVYQQFDRDIYEALESGLDLLDKYRQLTLVFPKDVFYPREIVRGFRNFCVHYKKDFEILDTLTGRSLQTGTAYIVLEDGDLAELVRQAKQRNLRLGQEVGVLAFNETPLKEVLADGIAVISTDHEKMGETAARLILSKQQEKVKNPFLLIRRASL
ncbi:GntR family transcriptional regulator [Larkinella soli]|uniref:GntR family transcriptional regulator n=1 Tax=Larkinella soli TaxID=1770527 RepID=UPI000FFB3EEE|nr:GntR family transcriptional regulator [Larkinella soli]